MIIQHNILALNANRQLGIITNNLSKSTEKLSSGYKINRAADDAAGLSISEKMRKQIRGLTQGVSNAEDGISLCQVADGALVEVTEMLQRINQLSVQAANGTLSSSDRFAIDTEVSALKTEINRVSTTTKFNEIVLFNRGYTDSGSNIGTSTGTGSGTGITPSAFPTGATTQITQASLSNLPSTVINGITHYTLSSGIYQIDSSITSAVFEISGDTVIKNSTLTDVSLSCAQGTHLFIENVNITNAKSNPTGINRAPIEVNGTGNILSISGTNNIKDLSGAIYVGSGTDLTIEGTGTLNVEGGAGAAIGGRYDNTLQNAGNWGTIIVNSGSIFATGGGGAAIGSATNAISTGTFIANGGNINCIATVAAAIGSGYGDVMYNALTNESSGTVIINGGAVRAHGMDGAAGIGGGIGRGGADVTINGGTVTASCWYDVNDPTAFDYSAAGIGAGAIFEGAAGNMFDPLIDLVNFGSLTITGGEVTSYGSFTTVASAGLPIGIGEIIDDDNSFSMQQISDYYAQYDETKMTANGQPITIADLTQETEYGRYVYRYKDSTAQPSSPVTATSAKRIKENLWIQSGAEAGDGIYITLYDINTTTLKLNQLSCLTQESATKAMDQINYALKEVSKQRSIIGAQQNRLEHTIKNESNIIENTTAAESKIRDTDMATEMVRYSNYNILAQAGQSMLAQAKQSNQGVLSLIA